jgi:hypothetical protein
MHLSMLNANQIKPNTPVVCSQNGQFGIVDHMEGADSIKLKKDAHGQHHYIPLSWVKNVDDKIHVDRPGAQAMKEWTTASAPAKDGAVAATSDRAPATTAPANPGAAAATKMSSTDAKDGAPAKPGAAAATKTSSTDAKPGAVAATKMSSTDAKDGATAKPPNSDGDATDKFDHATDIAMPAASKKKSV